MTATGGCNGGGIRKEYGRVDKIRQTVLSYSAVSVYACAHCGEQEAVLRLCGNCRSVVYCDLDCQRADWSAHKKFCKLRNPGYFDKSQAEKIFWFTELIKEGRPIASEDQEDHVLICLIDAFCVRCLDEKQAGDTPHVKMDIMNKFTRYLYAAKGAKLLPEPFKRSDMVAARHDALFRFRIDKIWDNGLESMRPRYADLEEAVTNLRNLHLAICGPIKFPDSNELNAI